jgi:hypothetical protein
VKLFPSKIPVNGEVALPIGKNPAPEFHPLVTDASMALLSVYELVVPVCIPCNPYTSKTINGSELIPSPVYLRKVPAVTEKLPVTAKIFVPGLVAVKVAAEV